MGWLFWEFHKEITWQVEFEELLLEKGKYLNLSARRKIVLKVLFFSASYFVVIIVEEKFWQISSLCNVNAKFKKKKKFENTSEALPENELIGTKQSLE